MHILLVEPDAILGRIYASALERAGHSVRLATGAQLAVDAADSQKPDVVVLELQLPAHGGVEFLYEFRSYAEWMDVPVVIHSNIPPRELQPVHETLHVTLGVRELLYKPATTLQELIRAIDQVATSREAAQ